MLQRIKHYESDVHVQGKSRPSFNKQAENNIPMEMLVARPPEVPWANRTQNIQIRAIRL